MTAAVTERVANGGLESETASDVPPANRGSSGELVDLFSLHPVICEMGVIPRQ